MNIESIQTYPLYHQIQEPYGDANGYKSYRSCFLICIRTVDGVEGWGECMDWHPYLEQSFQERIIPYLIGKKTTDRSQLVSTVRNWHHRAATGVSMALTEILARQAGIHICDLWGGIQHRQIPVYASFQSYTDRSDWIQHSLTQVERSLSAGYSRVKVKIGGRPLQEDMKHIEGVMQLTEGKVGLAVDANQSYDVSTALSWNRVFSKGDHWLWFEEPIPLDELSSYQLFRSRCYLPVAGGENLTGPTKFAPLIRQGALDIFQPDVAHSGGIGFYQDTIKMARHFGFRVSPHTYDGFLTRLYTLFCQACLSPWSKMAEESLEPVEWDVMENPFSTLISVQPKNGEVMIPEGIGTGVEWDREKLESFRLV